MNSLVVVNFNDPSIGNRVFKTGLEQMKSFNIHYKHRLIAIAGGPSDLISYHILPEWPCTDPMAITCNPFDPEISLTCIGNARILEGTTNC